MDIIYLDFKAFDKVPHKRLQKKSLGAWHPMESTQLDKGIFEEQITESSDNWEISYSAKLTSVILHGSVLDQILFLIYINELPEVLTASRKLFAGD